MTFDILLHRQAGALERLLNRCRRKGYTIVSMGFAPSEDRPGLDRVQVTFAEDVGRTDAVMTNLARCLDVTAIDLYVEAIAPTAQVA